MDGLTEAMERTNLSGRHSRLEELEQLLFQPQPESDVAETALDNIPRYLFRISSPRSDGFTNEIWVKSEAAHRNKISSTEDIFFNLDNEKRADIAQILSLHLWWSPKYGLDDNFVSWTSSLLFAIQYIYYRKSSAYDGSSLADIKLYVIDTTEFPRGTFMQDLDLIDIFCEYDDNLRRLQSLRKGPDFYFGEYLSQGPLKIENKCQVISAEVLFQRNRLRRIQPLFADIPSTTAENPRWAKEVIRLRGAIWPGFDLPILDSAVMLRRLTPILEIMENVAAEWRFPLAIYFAGLIGSESATIEQGTATDNVFFKFFRSEPFQRECSRNFIPPSEFCSHIESIVLDLRAEEKFRPTNFNIIVTDVTPELKQVRKLVREIHKYMVLNRVFGQFICFQYPTVLSFLTYCNTLDRVREVELIVRNLRIGGAFAIADDPNIMLAQIGQSIVSRLGTVQMLCEEPALDL